MRRRPQAMEEAGAVLPIAALLMVSLIVMSAIVIDHGRTRGERADARAAADAASTAAALDVATSAATACRTGLAYAFATLKVARPDATAISNACGSVTDTGATCPLAARTAALPVSTPAGTTTVILTHPVPDGSPLLNRATLVGGGVAQTSNTTTDGGNACLRVGVTITQPQVRVFGGIVSRRAGTFTVSSVARFNPTSFGGKGTPALVALDQHACDAISLQGNSEINVEVEPTNDLQALIYSDSDGADCANGPILSVSGSSNLRASVNRSGLPGVLGWYQAPFAKGWNTGSSNDPNGDLTSPAKYVGQLTTRPKRTTRSVPDTRYHCSNVTVTRPCLATDDAVATQLGYLRNGPPATYQTYTGSCSVPSGLQIALPRGDWVINCPDFQVKGGTFTFGGGNLYFTGSVTVAARGVLAVNTVPPPTYAGANPPAPIAIAGGETVMMVKGGFSAGSNAEAWMAQTTMVSGAGFDVGAGALVSWSPPPAVVPSTTSSRSGLLYWSEATGAAGTVSLNGGGKFTASGVFFAGEAPFTGSGNGELDLTKVQMWVKTVSLSGTPKLRLSSNPSSGLQDAGSGSSLIR